MASDAGLQRAPEETGGDQTAAMLAQADAIAGRMERRAFDLMTLQRDGLNASNAAKGWYDDAVMGVYKRCWGHFNDFQTAAKASGEATAAVTAFFGAINPIKTDGLGKMLSETKSTAEKVSTAVSSARTAYTRTYSAPKTGSKNSLSALAPESNRASKGETDARDAAPTDTKGVPGVGDVAGRVYEVLSEFTIRQMQITTEGSELITPAAQSAQKCREELRAAEKRMTPEEIASRLAELAKLEESTLNELDIILRGQREMLLMLTRRFFRPWPEDRKVEQDLWVLWLSGVFGLRWIADAPFQNENPFARAVSQHMVDIGVVARLEAQPWPSSVMEVAPVWYTLPDRARADVAMPEFRKYWERILAWDV